MNRFWVTLKYTIIRIRGQILGWGLGLGLYGLLIVSMYDNLSAQQEQLQKMIENYPKEFLAFFGGDASSLITPAGFLGMYAFSMMPILIGIFAVLAGSGLIVSDEERGRLDLIIAYPVGRSVFFFGRTLGLFSAAILIHLFGWLGFSLFLGRSQLGFDWGQMAIPFLSLLVQILVYASLALMLSMFLPSRNLSAMVSGAIVIIGYFVSSLSFINTRLEMISKLLPYHYYQTVLSFSEFNFRWFFSLIGVSLLMTSIGWLRFIRRDIRLAGDGSWKIFLRFGKRRL